MDVSLKGSAAFRYLDIALQPGETIITEAGAMASMSSNVDMKAQLNGGLFRGLARKFLGGESLFVSRFSNPTKEPQRLVLTSQSPGDIREHTLRAGESFCLEPGAYICSTTEIKIGLRWAGFTSFIAREGLFKLVLSGEGKFWYGGYGAFIERTLNGEQLVDGGHLVGYDPSIKLKLQLPSGIFGSFLGGEGFVSRLEGSGKYIIQTRSLSGLASWINPRF